MKSSNSASYCEWTVRIITKMLIQILESDSISEEHAEFIAGMSCLGNIYSIYVTINYGKKKYERSRITFCIHWLGKGFWQCQLETYGMVFKKKWKIYIHWKDGRVILNVCKTQSTWIEIHDEKKTMQKRMRQEHTLLSYLILFIEETEEIKKEFKITGHGWYMHDIFYLYENQTDISTNILNKFNFYIKKSTIH